MSDNISSCSINHSLRLLQQKMIMKLEVILKETLRKRNKANWTCASLF